MSFRYRMMLRLLKILGVKRAFRRASADMAAFVKQGRRRTPFKFPYKLMRDMHVELRTIRGRPCYLISAAGREPEHAILYFFGGGFMVEPGKRDIRFIREMIERSGASVMMPMLPLLSDGPFSEICAMAGESYESLLRDFPAEKIQFIGFSSGASLCLNVFAYGQLSGQALPWPRHMICSSPAWRVPPDETELAQMVTIDPYDPILSSAHIDAMGQFMAEADYPGLPSIDAFDFPSCCPITVMYGTDEIFYAYRETVLAWAKRNDAPVRLLIGDGLCHCWPAVDAPEGRQGRERIIKTLTSYMD
ncbi:MAG: alpha/beta hydrolase [Eubacteriales bacterium]|nr:alpha/beta hydrolase [Eubacteriales bacterium]